MFKNKFLFSFLALFFLFGAAWSQRLTDDREMFIGVTDNALVKPNVMVLLDNSISMEKAIYHPNYDVNINYMVDGAGKLLTINGLDDFFAVSADDPSYRVLAETITFNVCRSTAQYTDAYDVRGIYDGNKKNVWKIYRDIGNFASEQVIDYDGQGSGIDGKTRIITISALQYEKKTGKYYWDITIDPAYPGYDQLPDSGSYVYVNYRQVPTFTVAFADLTAPGDTCEGYDDRLLNVMLYGFNDPSTFKYGVLYDLNYLYWLCFHAKDWEVDQVTNWTNTGYYNNPNTGVYEYFGWVGLTVAVEVLAEVVTEVFESVRLGLQHFDSSEESGQSSVTMDVAQNEAGVGPFIGLLDNINTVKDTAPLAESMADIWYYFKGGTANNYWPNGTHDANTNCGVPEPGSCPMTHWCQKNYILLVSNGQARGDDFTNPGSPYPLSYFANTPVKKSDGGWGDDDDNDMVMPPPSPQPTDLIKLDGTAYCPNNACWVPAEKGTDLLDDMAYFLSHNDMFPDDGDKTVDEEGNTLYPAMPGMQNMETFVVGFNADNDMLAETAKNGNGVYYQAYGYTALKTAMKNAITAILLREFGFAAFTAPKKVTAITGEGYSFVGYFWPSLGSIWEGHLQSFKLVDKWCVDANNNGVLDSDPDNPDKDECATSYYYEQSCLDAKLGPCLRSIGLLPAPEWDTAEKILNTVRKLFTHDSTYSLIDFTDPANIATLQTLFGLPTDPLVPTYLTTAQNIVDTISDDFLGDVFHSDISYVGPPLPGKKYVKNLNPIDCDSVDKAADPDCYESLAAAQASRDKVVYVGTNDGILHQVDAVLGHERWGFIPDEILPSLKNIVIDGKYTFTADGRMTAEDIYYRGASNSWKTIVAFGLKDGGRSFYALDVTDVTSPQPTVLWKFKDADYSGKSWSKPYVGKIRYYDGTTTYDRWVVIAAGGMAFNNEDKTDLAGKAIFVMDASSGELIWMIGYHENGAADNSATAYLDTLLDTSYAGPGARYLTAKAEFNYPVPSAITPVDRDSDGFLDTIYFGNVAGHLFKTDISSSAPANWKSYLLFKKELPSTYPVTASVSSVVGTVLNVDTTKGFARDQNVFGLTSKAMGVIEDVGNKDLTVTTISPSAFFTAETIVVPAFDPIFLSPAVFFDYPSYNLWVAFGTGDRIRSRTNPDSGKFAALRDGTTVVSSATVQKTDIILDDLVPLTWTDDVINPTNIKVADKWGWYFIFPNAANHEKLFDPEPLVLPDLNLVPQIYFNTYQPSLETTVSDDVCNAPQEGNMYFYNLAMDYGNGIISGTLESGRIAGGGMFQGTDYVLFLGTGKVASIPPLQETKDIKLIYTGSLLFWKEKKR